MSWIDSMQKAIQYMEEHLLENITIDEIASHAHSSSFHFQRIFSILTDMTVGDYLRRRRLTLAAQELATSDAKIIDIAFKYGYETPESFAKAFRKQHDFSPSDVRNHIGRLKASNRLVIQVSLKGAEPMNYRIVERDGFKVAGVKRIFALQNEENLMGIPLMWKEHHAGGTNDTLLKLNNGDIKGLLGVCVDNQAEKEGTVEYWIATEHAGETPVEFEQLQVPASRWAVFEVRGPMPDAIQDT